MIAIAIVVAFSLLEAIAKIFLFLFAIALKSVKDVATVGRAITIWKAIQKRSHESIYKSDTNNEAKRLRATTLTIAKLEEQ